MQYVNRKTVAIGIVSYGIGCATEGTPGLYTKTSAYIDWIKDITKNGPEASVNFKMLESEKVKVAREARENQNIADKSTGFKFFYDER